MRNIFARAFRFIKYNHNKKLSLRCWAYSAFYRFQVLHYDTKKFRKKWGIEGEESPEDDTPEHYRYARKVSKEVNLVCGKTPWESLCLVRALTARKLLMEAGIPSTMYLGCKYDENGKAVAHAWLRAGKMYVTGGDGSGYAMVDKFRN